MLCICSNRLEPKGKPITVATLADTRGANGSPIESTVVL